MQKSKIYFGFTYSQREAIKMKKSTKTNPNLTATLTQRKMKYHAKKNLS